MEPVGYLRIFRERWLLIAVGTMVGLALAFTTARAITPTYEANATLFLKVESKGASLYERSQFSLQRVKSYGDLVSSPDLLAAVIDDLNLGETPGELSKRLSAVNPESTVLLVVTAEATSADAAAAIANAAATELARTVGELENSADDATSTIQLNLTLPAQVPGSAASPNTPVILGLGLIGGLTIGLISAIVIERARPRVRSAADIRNITGLPLIAQLPRSLAGRWRSADAVHSKSTTAALRNAAFNLRTIVHGALPSVITLVPVGPRPAMPGTRVGLVRALADTGRLVVLVESDLSSPERARLPLIEETTGLAEVLNGTLDVSDAIVPVDDEPFFLLPVGGADSLPPETAVEQNIRPVFDSIAALYDVAVVQAQVDSRPISLSAIAGVSKPAVLVTSFARTTARQLSRDLSLLHALDLVPLGVVMIDVPAWRRVKTLETWNADDFVNIEELEPVRAKAPVARKPRRSRSAAARNRARVSEPTPIPAPDAAAVTPAAVAPAAPVSDAVEAPIADTTQSGRANPPSTASVNEADAARFPDTSPVLVDDSPEHERDVERRE